MTRQLQRGKRRKDEQSEPEKAPFLFSRLLRLIGIAVAWLIGTLVVAMVFGPVAAAIVLAGSLFLGFGLGVMHLVRYLAR